MFTAGDVNHDGVMSLDEFSSIVKFVDPDLMDRQVVTMFRNAHGSSGEGITKQTFVKVALKNGLLTSRATPKRIFVADEQVRVLGSCNA